MMTAVDSSVLLDVLTNDADRCPSSLAALEDARRLGTLVACPVVWAELRAFFDDAALMSAAFEAAGIRFDPFDQAVSELAGEMWRAYRHGGGARTRLVPDFLVGAHARLRAGRLLTRDRGFFRRYFTDLTVTEPVVAR